MTATRFLLLSLAIVALSACSSLNTRNTILRDMAIGAAVGTLVGQTKSDNREAYTAMYAGIGAASAGAISAIYYAVNNGAKIINNSWGGPTYSQSLHDALTYAYNNKVTIVVAAGNYNSNNDTTAMYPANFPIPSLASEIHL